MQDQRAEANYYRYKDQIIIHIFVKPPNGWITLRSVTSDMIINIAGKKVCTRITCGKEFQVQDRQSKDNVENCTQIRRLSNDNENKLGSFYVPFFFFFFNFIILPNVQQYQYQQNNVLR